MMNFKCVDDNKIKIARIEMFSSIFDYIVQLIFYRLDNETEELHHDRVPLSFGKVLQQARQAKKWTQKDLAMV